MYNRVGEIFSPLLVAPPVRHPSGIFPLHGRVHKKAGPSIFPEVPLFSHPFSLFLKPLKHHRRLDPVSAHQALAAAVGGRDRVQAITLGRLVVDHRLQLRQISGAGAHELFF